MKSLLLCEVIFDNDSIRPRMLPGQRITEWLDLIDCWYNDVDRIYVDFETVGC